MSDYSRNKVIRLKVTDPVAQFGVKDLWDLEDKYPDLFGNSDVGKFDIAPTESDFVDFVLFHSYGEECGDFGYARYLSEEELGKALHLFRKIAPDVSADDLRYVDYCFYNCTEAPDYFEADETENCFSIMDQNLLDI